MKIRTDLQFQTMLLVWLVATAFLLVACGEKPREATGRLDTPSHHSLRGNDFLEENNLEKAEREFDLALSLNKEYSPALAGKAVVTAIRSDQPGTNADRRKELAEEAQDLLDKAKSEAKDDTEERVVFISGIRVARLTKSQDQDWLSEARKSYTRAIKTDQGENDPRPYFYMARAYRDAFELTKASDLYRHVLGMNKGKTREADDELAVLQLVQRAAPGSTHGKTIAFVDSITRADIAALFISELKLAALYQRDNQGRFDTSFKKPQNKKFEADRMQKAPDATDIDKHPMRADIEEVLQLGVLGLEPDPAHKFHPDALTTRAEFALMVEDILVKVTGEEKLKTRFIGQNSPFADVRNDVPYFNAIQTVVSRNLMTPKNKIRGLFAPLDPVQGVDALLVIRQLKIELQSYLRRS